MKQHNWLKNIHLPLLALVICMVAFQPCVSPAKTSHATEDIWAIVANNAKLHLDFSNARIQEQIEFYRKRPHVLNRITDQAEPYLHYILAEIERRNLPHELILLPIMESAFDPTAKSHAGAAGLWQFMPRTADHFGIKRDWWYDGRRDIHDSTDKALEYMHYLVKFFDGDWLLAAAAYDAGEGTVKRAIKKNEKEGKKTDYWHLPLPREAQIYVPRFLALATMFANPEKYGLDLSPVENKPYLKRVDIGRQMSLPKIAELAHMDLDTLASFNPAYQKLVLSPEGPHFIMVPVANASFLEKNLAKVSKDDHRTWFKYHTSHGESLSDIALRHDTSESMIKKVNKLADNFTPKPGLVLALPKPIKHKIIPTQPFGQQKMDYTITKNDSLWTISKKFQVKLSDLKKWNPNLKGDKLFAGETLTLWMGPQKSITGTPAEPKTYTVVRGDSLSVIAKRFHTSVDALKALNDLTKDSLQIGQTLTVPMVS